MSKIPKYNYIDSYLKEIQSKGRYSVTLKEIIDKFSVSERAILQNIYRLKTKKQLAQVRKEFYVIIPPQYSSRGMLPTSLFIDDLMVYLDRDYYVSLFSAAALHGAGHQQPMNFQVISSKPPLRNISNTKLSISFFTKKRWEKEQVEEKKTETGYIKVSTPELTAFDLVYYHKKIGGLNRIIPILEELKDSMKASILEKTAKNQINSTIQRLGYLLEELGSDSLANSLYRVIEKKSIKDIQLSLSHPLNKEIINGKWKVIINTELDLL